MMPASASPRARPRPSGESGYAMLLVFLIAAMIAIALYSEMPRVAFEAQRSKEQLLIERGEQYKRAIQLFVRKVNRYPATIEELESTNNFRFLRKRYLDPMTGKEKWRLIHINGGVLTDSIIQKNKAAGDPQQPANTNTFIAEGPILGATNDPNQQQINPALRRRASDDRPVVAAEAPVTPQPDADQDTPASDSDNSDETPAPGTPGASAIPGMPNQPTPGIYPGRTPQPGMYQPGAYPGQPGFNPASSNQPYGMPGSMSNQISPGGASNNGGQNAGQDSSGSVYVAPSLGQAPAGNSGLPSGVSGQPAYPGQTGGYPGQAGAFPGQMGGMPGRPGFGGQPGGFGQPAYPGQTGGFGQPAQTPFAGGDGSSQNPNGAGIGMGDLGLGSPRPGGMQGLPGMGGTQVGGGIAGVASESIGPAIKIYNERKKYNEWEFVYDQSKDRGLAGVRPGGTPGTPAPNMGSMPGQQPGAGFSSGNPNGGAGGNSGSNTGFSLSPGVGSPGQQQPQPQPQQPPN